MDIQSKPIRNPPTETDSFVDSNTDPKYGNNDGFPNGNPFRSVTRIPASL